jgi:NAD(P) transhydrogenase subunit beta
MSGIFYISYLVAAVCFIMALRGLSSPVSARQGNLYGMAGMAIGILTTLCLPQVHSYTYTIVGIAVGGTIGTVIAKRIAMTAMPQLVAAFHSLVGLAAVLIALAALWSPEAYGIATPDGGIHPGSLIEMSLGVIIGAITFTGSIISPSPAPSSPSVNCRASSPVRRYASRRSTSSMRASASRCCSCCSSSTSVKRKPSSSS